MRPLWHAFVKLIEDGFFSEDGLLSSIGFGVLAEVME